MSDVFEADPSSIENLSDEISGASANISFQLQGLTSELNYLMTQWSGEASAAYLSAQTEWNSSMASMQSILAEAGALLSGIAARYKTTESAVVRASGA
jgi:WXG100 family type VII secretion target